MLKELCRDHQTIKKAVENIIKLRTQSKGKGFKNLLLRDEWKLKWVIAKQPFLINAQIFEKAKIKGVEKNKKSRIFCDLELEKKFPWQPPVTKANILKQQNWAKKYIKIF